MDLKAVVSQLKNLLSFNNVKSNTVPPPLILAASNRSGLSAIQMTQEFLKWKQEVGLPVGTLSDGSANLDDAAIGKLFEIMVKWMQEKAKIDVAVKMYGTVTASGVAGPGLPVTTQGIVTTIQTGSAIIS